MNVPANSYWNGTGLYQQAANLLDLRVPDEGEVENAKKNKALERFRRASNCYHDLYNNGLCNRASEFRHVFGFSAVRGSYRGRYGRAFSDIVLERTERELDAIVVAAAVEQGLALQVELSGF